MNGIEIFSFELIVNAASGSHKLKVRRPLGISMWVVAPIRATLWSLLLAGGQNHVSSGPTPCGALPCSVDIRVPRSASPKSGVSSLRRWGAQVPTQAQGQPRITTITSTSWRQQRMRYGERNYVIVCQPQDSNPMKESTFLHYGKWALFLPATLIYIHAN